jgi:hypothetical protein
MLSVQKSPNGQARSKSYLLVFDETDDSEMKAWKVAQELASERKLKQVLIGLLVAVHNVQHRTGKKLDLIDFMASFITGLVTGGTAYPMLTVTDQTSEEDLPIPFVGTADHVDPAEARQTFSAGLSNLFDEDDDLWDE